MNRFLLQIPGFGLLACLVAFTASAENLVFTSSEKQLTVIELFTSQGCSSCPAAERWLNNLIEKPGLWQEFIPLAFHVDYWDRLGWKDIYAKPEHTQRQYRYQQDGNVDIVYTPGFFTNGQEWRDWSNWFSWELPPSDTVPGVLTVVVQGDVIRAQFNHQSTGARPGQVLNVAVLGFKITTPVKAGENSGRELVQNFVVLGHQQSVSENGRWEVGLPAISNAAEKYALVGWVSNIDNQAPLQATGGWLSASDLP